MAHKMADAAATAAANAESTLYNSGKLQLWTGAQPATGNTAGSGTKLAEFTLNATAFGSPASSGGNMVLTANSIAAVSVLASGVAASYVAYKSDGTTLLGNGTVGGTAEGTTSGKDLILNASTLVSGAQVSISSYTKTITQ